MLRIDRNEFSKAFVARFPKPVLTPGARRGLEDLLSQLESDSAIESVGWAAYMLATVKHECANRWLPVTEFGQRPYFRKYDAGTPIGARLGNTRADDGYRFRGRGYVQITGRRNYTVLGQKLGRGRELIDNPELALRPDISYAIMSHGMRNGSFTGRKLQQFISPGHCDYVNARKIINGLDRAQQIAEYARAFEALLLASAKVQPAEPAVPATTPTAPLVPVAPVAPVPPVPPVPVMGSAPSMPDAAATTLETFQHLGFFSGWG